MEQAFEQTAGVNSARTAAAIAAFRRTLASRHGQAAAAAAARDFRELTA